MVGVVVGFDGSGSAGRALRWAYAATQGRALTVVTVVEERLIPGTALVAPASEEDLAQARAAAQAAVDELATESSGLVSCKVVACGGQPAAVLLDQASGADHLVVGSRGQGGFARLLLGSVSSQVVHHAKCPVTVVPEPAADHG